MNEILTSANEQTIALPTPQLDNTFTLAGALQKRRTDREFSSQPLSREILSAILWCAFGVNRPQSGYRTAPSARNWQEIDVYVVMPEGTYRYEAKEHALSLVMSADLRAATGTQDFVGVAPLNLVYIADFDRMTDTTPERRILYSAADAGMIVQNVYLYCAAAGLACVVRGLVDRDKLMSALGLCSNQQIILAHTVGYA
jgi:SagB-type dehydrogenase family enzyme